MPVRWGRAGLVSALLVLGAAASGAFRLFDGLESIESDELVLKLISPLRPGLIESPDTGDFVYLIMPIRLNV